MKNLLIVLFMIAGIYTGRIVAQNPQTNKEKIKELAGWVGHWQGEGSMQMGPGEPKKSSVDEHIEAKLDGTVLLVEGVGKAVDPTTGKEAVVHHALAVLSYDQASGQYKFKSYLNDGRATDAWFNALGNNQYQWGFDSPRGKIRYNITIDPAKKTWKEVGEFSEGANWRKFFEMNLVKID
jgi:hypothetical protein